MAAIEAHFEPLLSFPLMGPRREQFGTDLRVVFHSHYGIYYLPTDRDITIVRVLDGARDAVALAEQGGFKL